jgi:hypothetical protein
MPVDTMIPHGQPGVAAFDSQTFGGPLEPRFGEGVPTTTELTITAGGSGLTLPLYSVIAATGALAQFAGDPAASNAYGILAAPITLAANQTMTIPVYREGYFEVDALNWHTTFNSDARKFTAFEGSPSPTIFVGRNQHKPAAINL